MPTCKYCAKSYAQKTAHFRRHEQMCEFIQMTPREQEDELEELPPLRTMYHLLINLIDDNKKLKTEVKRLRTNARQTVDPKERLSHQVRPSQTFTPWCKTLTDAVTYEHLEYTIANDHNSGMPHAAISLIQTAVDIPMRAFEEHRDSIFIYEDDGWTKMTNSEWASLMKSIEKGLAKQFQVWEERAKQTMTEKDFGEHYMSNLGKVVNMKSTRRYLPPLKRAIYEHLIHAE